MVDRNESDAISGTECNGCKYMSVLEKGRRIIREEYYCNRLRRRIKPEGECIAPQGSGKRKTAL